MKRAYLLLFAGTIAAGLLLVAMGRFAPRRESATGAAAPALPAVSLSIRIQDGTVTPETHSVPKGRRVILQVANRGSKSVTLTLAGYEDRLDLGAIEPGGERSGEFFADRPGEDFTWLLDGEPAGRLAVTGSHLVDGHR